MRTYSKLVWILAIIGILLPLVLLRDTLTTGASPYTAAGFATSSSGRGGGGSCYMEGGSDGIR